MSKPRLSGVDEIDQNTHDVATYRTWRKAVSLILLVTGILIFSELTLPYVNEPFIHHHDFNSAYWSLVARNYAENGVLRSGFAMVVNTGPLLEDTELLIDIRHPPLYPLILSTGIRIFGDRELSTRIVQWFLSIVLIIVIYFTLKNLFSQWASVITALLTLFTPAFVYFSVVCDFEYLNLIFIFLSIWAYVRWFREPARKGKLVLSLLFCFLSSQVDWQGYELAVLVVHAFIYRSDIRSRGGNWKLALLYFPTCLISLLFYLVFVITVYSGGINMLLQRFLARSGLESYSMFSFELLLGYFHRVYRNFKYMFTRAYVYTFILFYCYLAWLALRQPEKRGDFSISMALILFGIVHFVLFSDATLVHDYLTMYFMPAFTFTIAASLKRLSWGTYKKITLPVSTAFVFLILVPLGIESKAIVERFRVAVTLDVREPAAELARITPVDSVVYTNMVYEGHQLGYYSRREIIYANVDEDRLSNRNVYYLEFEGGTCQEKYSIRSIEEVKSSRVINSSSQLIHTAPCFSIYSVDF